MKQVFQYLVILDQYDEPKNGETVGVYRDSKVIMGPTIELAKSEKDLVFSITRAIPEEHAGNPDNVRIIIRNF